MSETHADATPRRQFLKYAAGVLSVTVAPSVLLHTFATAESSEPVSAQRRWGLLIDTSKCANCSACVTACQQENGLSSEVNDTVAQWIRKVELQQPDTGKVTSLPMLCQHCQQPPCVDVCPTGASFQRADGIVLVDKHICIGCRYCMMACPYKARSFIHEPLTEQKAHAPRGKGTVESCTLCVHRVDAGELPACVSACGESGNKAMLFGDLNDANSPIAQRLKTEASTALRADLRLQPNVRYQGI